MERRKALLAATIGAATLVAGSFAYAATNLVTASPDNVGKLQAKLPQPVQVVFDDAPLPPADASGTAPAFGSDNSLTQQSATGSPATDSSASRDDDAPAGSSFTSGTANDDAPPSTLIGGRVSDDDESDDRYESDEHDDQEEPHSEDEDHEEYEDD